jgi:hypothetical protein
MCDNAERSERIVDYLYGELDADRQQEFEAHLEACATCRTEVAGLGLTRERMAEWAPSEPAEAGLGLRVVREGADRPPPAPLRGAWATWGLAAAATLVLAASAAIANLEIRVGSEGLVVRTGWAQAGVPVAPAAGILVADSNLGSEWQSDLARVQARLSELEAGLASQPAAGVQSVSNPGGLSDAEVLRRVRLMVEQSQGDVLRRVSEVFVEMERQRRQDLALIQQGLGQYQATSAEIAQHRDALVKLARVAWPEQEK